MKPISGLPPWTNYLFLYIVCIGIESIFFGKYLIHPNDYVFAFGGDALVIYYDMIYQVCHGHGYHLGAMNYPYGESLFMTDANAAITLVLQKINTYINICEFVPGILHLLILYLLPLTSIFLFKILRKFYVSLLSSVVFSLLITFLNPQLLRILGHFGLAYPFIIPMAIYWIITKWEQPAVRGKDFLYVLILLFFFLNNPYLGFAGTSLIAISGLIGFFFNKRKGVILLMMGTLPTLAGYLVILLTDPFQDRIEMQWGFFHYFASIQGMLFPNGSLIYEGLKPWIDVPGTRFEGRVNIGMVSTMVLLVVIVASLFSKKLKMYNDSFRTPFLLKIMLWGAFFIFMYAANYSLYGFAKNFMEDHMGALLMFKASGRLAWPLYFVFTIYAAILLDRWLIRGKGQNKARCIVIYLIAISVWGFEAYQMNAERFKNIFHANPFTQKDFKENIRDFPSAVLSHQAIYMLPVIQSWNDKYYFPMHFQTQYSGVLWSALTGMPMINAMLSRAPLSTTLSSIQMAASPDILRERITDMDIEKPILLVLGDKHPPLTEGELFLLNASSFVGTFAKARLYSCNLKKLNTLLSYRERTILINTEKEINTTPGNNLIWQGNIQPDADSIGVELWYKLESTSYHNPKIKVTGDSYSHEFYDRSTRDYAGNWVRQRVELPASKTLIIEALGERPFLIKDLVIYEKR
jgi:hypothetical protein